MRVTSFLAAILLAACTPKPGYPPTRAPYKYGTFLATARATGEPPAEWRDVQHRRTTEQARQRSR
jgi:hypothetical protein